jgi:hypothetical protein
MTDLERVLETTTGLFEQLGVPYALMGGIAVRTYGIPRPTYDIDFTIALERVDLPILFHKAREVGYTIPEEYTDRGLGRSSRRDGPYQAASVP